MEPPISALLYAVLLFFGMLILLEVGRRLWCPASAQRVGR